MTRDKAILLTIIACADNGTGVYPFSLERYDRQILNFEDSYRYKLITELVNEEYLKKSGENGHGLKTTEKAITLLKSIDIDSLLQQYRNERSKMLVDFLAERWSQLLR